MTSLSNPPMPSSSYIASSNTLRFFLSGSRAARIVLISSSFDSKRGLIALDNGAAPDDDDRSDEGTISTINERAMGMILSVAIMKSRAMMLILFGSTTSFSVLEYICGYRLCTALRAASVHKAYVSNATTQLYPQIGSSISFRLQCKLHFKLLVQRRIPLLRVNINNTLSRFNIRQRKVKFPIKSSRSS